MCNHRPPDSDPIFNVAGGLLLGAGRECRGMLNDLKEEQIGVENTGVAIGNEQGLAGAGVVLEWLRRVVGRIVVSTRHSTRSKSNLGVWQNIS